MPKSLKEDLEDLDGTEEEEYDEDEVEKSINNIIEILKKKEAKKEGKPETLKGVSNKPKDKYRWIAVPKGVKKVRHGATKKELGKLLEKGKEAYKIIRRPPHASRGKKITEIKKNQKKVTE